MSAERYLWRLLESALDPYDETCPSPAAWHVAAEALEAVGAVEPELAARLGLALATAVALRDGSQVVPAPWPTVSAGGGGRSAAAPVQHPAPESRVGPARTGCAGVPAGTPGHRVPEGPILGYAAALDAEVCLLRWWGDDTGPPPLGYEPLPRPRPPARARPGATRSRPHPGPAVPGPPDPRHREVVAQDDTGRHFPVEASVGNLRSGVTARLGGLPPAGARWLDVGPEGAPPVRVHLGPARAPVRGRPHQRSPATRWLLGAIAAALTSDRRRPLGPGVQALLAVGALEVTSPLVHQAGLVDQGGGGLDPRFASAQDRTSAPPTVTGCWPVAALLELGERVVRIDVLRSTGGGTTLGGALGPAPPGPGSGGGPPLQLTAFDDLHNWYALEVRSRGVLGGSSFVTWAVRPHLDPRAASLRVDVSDASTEASVEVRLR